MQRNFQRKRLTHSTTDVQAISMPVFKRRVYHVLRVNHRLNWLKIEHGDQLLDNWSERSPNRSGIYSVSLMWLVIVWTVIHVISGIARIGIIRWCREGKDGRGKAVISDQWLVVSEEWGRGGRLEGRKDGRRENEKTWGRESERMENGVGSV